MFNSFWIPSVLGQLGTEICLRVWIKRRESRRQSSVPGERVPMDSRACRKRDMVLKRLHLLGAPKADWGPDLPGLKFWVNCEFGNASKHRSGERNHLIKHS